MKSLCHACREIFKSVSGFDKHRVGSYRPLARRCLTPAEMHVRGMSKNERGWWITSQREEESPADDAEGV